MVLALAERDSSKQELVLPGHPNVSASAKEKRYGPEILDLGQERLARATFIRVVERLVCRHQACTQQKNQLIEKDPKKADHLSIQDHQ